MSRTAGTIAALTTLVQTLGNIVRGIERFLGVLVRDEFNLENC
jgi:hypothetical protein